jgi:hypothetical protein
MACVVALTYFMPPFQQRDSLAWHFLAMGRTTTSDFGAAIGRNPGKR